MTEREPVSFSTYAETTEFTWDGPVPTTPGQQPVPCLLALKKSRKLAGPLKIEVVMTGVPDNSQQVKVTEDNMSIFISVIKLLQEKRQELQMKT